MNNIYREACFSKKKKKKKNVYKWAKYGFATFSPSQKDSSRIGNTLGQKVLVAGVSKEGHAVSFLGHERTHYFLVNSASYCKLLRQKFTLFIE